jgi:hypothetical protein
MADGGSISEAAQWPETTVLVPVGRIRTVEFIANNPADWAIHCHMTHHVMNQMFHRQPNIVGIEPNSISRCGLPARLHDDGAGRHEEVGEMAMKIPPNSVPMVGSPGRTATSLWGACTPT